MSKNDSVVSYELGDVSAFQLIFAVIVFLGIILNAIVGFTQNNIGMVVLSMIFGLMMLFSLIISKGEILSAGNWKSNTVSFTLGAFLWGALVLLGSGGNTQSIFSVSENVLYSTLSGQVPLYTDFVFTSFVIPITEEYIWMIAIPYFVFGTLTSLSESIQYKISNTTKIFVTVLVAGSTFALFHVQNLELITFLISALIFRTVMILAVIPDQTTNWFKFLNILPSFAFGSHIANNWLAYGFERGLGVLLNVTDPFLFMVSIIILGVLGLFIGSGTYFILREGYNWITK